MSQKGAFFISREIFDNKIWNDPLKFRLFVYIVGNAVYSKEGLEVAGVALQRGQFLRSLRNLQEDLAYREGRGGAIKKPPLETLRRKIKELENEGRINCKSTDFGTLFTVLNYSKYQDLSHYQNDKWDSNETAMGQQWDNTNKDNKDKKVNNKKSNVTNYKFDDKHLKLAELLFRKIKENNPSAKEPNFDSWANTFRLMMERDERQGKEIQDLILWTQQDSFWYKNILSPDKLRKQYDRLVLEMGDKSKPLQVINGGKKNESNRGNYESDVTKYDFSKRKNL